MAQFGRHLFGTSLFGKSNSFIGTYDTKLIDVGEPFSEKIEVMLECELPNSKYYHNDKMFHYTGNKVVRSNNTLIRKNSKVSTYVSGKNIVLNHGLGSASVTVKEQETEEVRTYTTNNSGKLAFDNFPVDELRNFTITITATEDFVLHFIEVRTTEVQGMVRATTEELGQGDYFEGLEWPLSFKSEATKEHDKTWIYNSSLTFKEVDGELVADTESFVNVRYVQLKLILLTTDENTSPIIDNIQFFSGDLSKYRSSGIWRAAINMNNVAVDKNTQFERVKRVEWIEQEDTFSNIDLHSSSSPRDITARTSIMNDSAWSKLTAKYVLQHNGINFGTPYGRASLNEKDNVGNNGINASSATIGAMTFGPVNTLSFGFTNTVINKWNSILGSHHYPRNSKLTDIIIEIYESENDVSKNKSPLVVIENPETERETLFRLSNQYDNLYIKIVLKRRDEEPSPVFDVFNLNSELSYESARNMNNYGENISALDGYEKNNQIGKGIKQLESKNKIKRSHFDWPSTNQNLPENRDNVVNSKKRLELNFNPKYNNQVFIGIGHYDNRAIEFTNIYPEEYKIYSKVEADTPEASVHEVRSNRLYYHFNYDGGTINFPTTTYRELDTQFTPSLLKNKRYRYLLKNGWDDEKFILPYTMSIEEAAELTMSNVVELKEVNKNIPLHDGLVNINYELNLPNNSLNELVNLEFEKSKDVITTHSVLNEKENDRIRAWINKGENFKYTEWTSEEKIFQGVININDENKPYFRRQNSAHNVRQQSTHVVSLSKETARQIASRFNVNLEDLLIANNRKSIFTRNEKVIIPAGYSLPDIVPSLIYEGDHPYEIEVIPGSIRRTKGNVRLQSDVLIPGADDQEAISYTLTESGTETILIKRGSVRNGRDFLPVSNVIKIESIRRASPSETYIEASSSMGDYILKDNHIDWSPTFRNSKEPEAGQMYEVTLTRGVIDTLNIVYTSNYVEKMSQDKMAAIPIIEEKEYSMDLREDQIIELPKISDMQKEYSELYNLRYVSENSDLWVNTEIKDNQLRVTLNGENPNINWYPTINTGYYYLNNKEHYLYSRPTKTVYGDKEIPIIKNVEYTGKGLIAPKE